MAIETLRSTGSSSVEIHHHGAHITSWKDSSGREMIYTSPNAIYDGKKAIRGGIPICFPQFAKHGPLQQHGFARNVSWRLDKYFLAARNAPNCIRFHLSNDNITNCEQWPFRFAIEYTVALSDDGNSLSITMDVLNHDAQPFTFTTALHAYFTCDAAKTSLPDFENGSYTDSTDTTTTNPKVQNGHITFGKEVDRIYYSTADTISIPTAALVLEKLNLPEAVVWNPYEEKAAAMSDLPDDGWQNFICIEPARIAQPAVVQPGTRWSCSCVLKSSTPPV